jgi:glutamate--cysteine ligase
VTLTRDDPELERPVEDVEQLVEYFRSGEKTRDRFRLGTEHEKLGVYRDSLRPVPYEGERGIEALLHLLAHEPGFSPLLEGGRIIGVDCGGATITLEPGGQLELSGAPLRTVHETCREFREHVALINRVSQPFGIAWLGLGIHPLAKIEEIPQVPRDRYTVMRSYLGSRDELGMHMMHATATVQVNVDFSSQADVAHMMRMALAASPVVAALYANSGLSEGVANGFESRRMWIWRYTDPDRCGFLPFVFDAEWGPETAYRTYAQWAMDVPMFFVVRGGRHIPAGGRTFRRYLQDGLEGHRATLLDWQIHLTTLFPEVRLKKVIELRGADGVPPGLVCALPALWKGLLYDERALTAAADRLRRWTWRDVDGLHADVARRGLCARSPDEPLVDVARELLDLAEAGLARIAAESGAASEVGFLEPLREIVERGSSPARELLAHWDRDWDHRLGRLVEYAAY